MLLLLIVKTTAAIQAFLNSRLAQNLRPDTITWYRQKLERFSQACPQLPKNRRPIEAFLAGLKHPDPEKKYTGVTIQNYFMALRAFFRFISEENGTRNPMARMRMPRSNYDQAYMATLDVGEVLRLVLATASERDRVILTLLVDTGLRVGELLGLRKMDIQRETVIVSGKSGTREVPVSHEVRRSLLSLGAGRSENDYIFYGRKGRLTRYGIYGIVRRVMKDAGINAPKLGPHRVRHGFAKIFLVNGGDLRSLQEILGHKKITTTERYIRFADSEIIEKHRKYSPLKSVTPQLSFLDDSK